MSQAQRMTQLVRDGGVENAIRGPRTPWRRLQRYEDISARQLTCRIPVEHRHAWIARRKPVGPIEPNICFQWPAHHGKPYRAGAHPGADGFLDKLFMPLRPPRERRGRLDPEAERASSRPAVGTSSRSDRLLLRRLDILVMRNENNGALLHWRSDYRPRCSGASCCGTTSYDC